MGMSGELVGVSKVHVDLLRRHPERITAFLQLEVAQAGNRVHLGKAWHVVHYMLTGERRGGEPPLSLAVLGGQPVGDVDVGGYGPAQLLTLPQVKAVAEALNKVSEKTYRDFFDLEELQEANIYPLWHSTDEEAEWQWAWAVLVSQRAFYQIAAEQDQGVLFWVH